MADDKAAPIKKKKTSKRYENYDGAKRKNKFCPKCGPGIFMGQHKDRVSCGKCGYTEFVSKGDKKE